MTVNILVLKQKAANEHIFKKIQVILELMHWKINNIKYSNLILVVVKFLYTFFIMIVSM